MLKINYDSPEYARMVAWTNESLVPYINETLIPQFANTYFSLALEPGGATHTRVLKGVNATPNLAVRVIDLEQFGNMTAMLLSEFGNQLWTPSRPSFVRERQKIMAVQHTIGGNVNYNW